MDAVPAPDITSVTAASGPDRPPAPDLIVVMGVSGCGKTTIARGIATAMRWEFAEGDDFHSAANVAKMRSGQPLTDADRQPWLALIAAWLRAHDAAGRSGVVTCSALRRSYRDLLRTASRQVRFCFIDVPLDVLRTRLRARTGHYMPLSLLDSQLATLEPLAADEPGLTVHAAATADEALEAAMRALGLSPENESQASSPGSGRTSPPGSTTSGLGGSPA